MELLGVRGELNYKLPVAPVAYPASKATGTACVLTPVASRLYGKIKCFNWIFFSWPP